MEGDAAFRYAIDASIVISRDIRMSNILSLSSPPGGRLDTS